MSGGKSPRQKGDRLEREVVKALIEAGIKAKRVPLSGSVNGYPGDVLATLPGLGETVLECKSRKASTLYSWLEGRDGLIVKGDRKEPLIVCRLEDFLKLVPKIQELKDAH